MSEKKLPFSKTVLVSATVFSFMVTGATGAYIYANANTSSNSSSSQSSIVKAEVSNPNLVDIVSANADLSTLKTAVISAGLLDTVKNGEFTVLAPNNDAFAKLPSDTLKDLLKPENKKQLENILLYHVIPGKFDLEAVKKQTSIKTVLGQQLSVKVEGQNVILNGSIKVIASDVKASNGIAHVIDTVLIPSPQEMATTSNSSAKPALSEALNNPNLSKLKELVGIAGINADTLKNTTVFAPTNDAFAKLPASLITYLHHNPEVLKQIILGHVVNGELNLQSVLQFLSSSDAPVINANSKPLSLSSKDGKVFVNSSQVIQTDIATQSGIVHLLDTAIL